MSYMEKEPTNTEILEAVNRIGTNIQNTDKHVGDVIEVINAFSTKVDEHFDTIEKDIETLKGDVGTLKGDVASIKATLTTMPTRDDLSEKLADTKGDIITTVRKEDTKLRTLVEVLREKNVLNDPDIKRILSLEPFPQLFV